MAFSLGESEMHTAAAACLDVDSTDVAKVGKKAGKAKRFANKLRTTFSRKNRESIDGWGSQGEGARCLHPDSEGGNTVANTKKSLEERLTPSFKKLKKVFTLVGGETTRSDGNGDVSVSTNSDKIPVDWALQPIDRVTEPEVDAAVDVHDLKFALEVEGKPGQAKHAVTISTELDSAWCPLTPDAGMNGPKQVSDSSDSWNNAVRCPFLDFSEFTDAAGAERLPEAVKASEIVSQQPGEGVQILVHSTGTASDTPQAAIEKLPGEAGATQDAFDNSVQKASDPVPVAIERRLDAVELTNCTPQTCPNGVQITAERTVSLTTAIDACVKQTPETPRQENEPVDDVVGAASDAIDTLERITRTPTNASEPIDANQKLSDRVVPHSANVQDRIDAGVSDGDKFIDAPITEDGGSELTAPRAVTINTADLNCCNDCGDQRCARKDARVPPKEKKKKTALWKVTAHTKIEGRGRIGIAVSATFLVAKLLSQNR